MNIIDEIIIFAAVLTVISAIALAIPIVLGIIGIALFSAKKKKEEE